MAHGSFRLGVASAGQTMRWICWKSIRAETGCVVFLVAETRSSGGLSYTSLINCAL